MDELNRVSLVAITVSTNYSDIFPIVYEANSRFFKRWIVVTDHTDRRTIEFLSSKELIVPIFYDFRNNGRTFDKGGALQYAQTIARALWPSDWHLIIDSDICLDDTFINVSKNIEFLDCKALYGCANRYDYGKLSDYRNKKNGRQYPQTEHIVGFFQLYAFKKYLYGNSFDASACDVRFSKKFRNRINLDSFICHHLGNKNAVNHRGRVLGSDFTID
jgi:hypothetical protein